jgi:hypothetical protein
MARWHRLSVVTSVMVLGLLTTAIAAAAQEPYPPGPAAESVDCDTPVPGTTVECTAGVFEPNSTVEVTVTRSGAEQAAGEVTAASFAIVPVGTLAQSSFPQTETVQADDEGFVTFAFTIPEDAEPGETFTITFSGVGADGEPLVISESITVEAAAPGLAVTGANITNGTLLGIGLVVLGAGAVLGSRRRSRKRESAAS